jgi:hypothetical protein
MGGGLHEEMDGIIPVGRKLCLFNDDNHIGRPNSSVEAIQ